MQWFLGPLLERLTTDKIPFHKIFKKLLQTVKTMLAYLYGISILKVKKKKLYSNLDKSYNSGSFPP